MKNYVHYPLSSTITIAILSLHQVLLVCLQADKCFTTIWLLLSTCKSWQRRRECRLRYLRPCYPRTYIPFFICPSKSTRKKYRDPRAARMRHPSRATPNDSPGRTWTEILNEPRNAAPRLTASIHGIDCIPAGEGWLLK